MPEVSINMFLEHKKVTSDHLVARVALGPPGYPITCVQICMWDTHPDLIPTVQRVWEANGPNLTAAEVRANLQSLSNNLGEWSKSTFGSVKSEIRRLKKDLERLRSDLARSAPSHVEIKTNDQSSFIFRKK